MFKTCNALCAILFFKFIIVVAPHKSEKCDHLEHNLWVRLKATTNLQVTRKKQNWEKSKHWVGLSYGVITKHIGAFVPNKLKDVPNKKILDNLTLYATKGYMQISTMENH
jgi:hypothetical protein